MGAENEGESRAGGRGRRNCGYRYMMPSYALDAEQDAATSYFVIADALLENSSAHGFPTLFHARGLNIIHNLSAVPCGRIKGVPGFFIEGQ